jgi:hypothetical protein
MSEQLADKFKNKFGGDTKGITSLVSSIKRTKTSLHDIEFQFAKIGQITDEEKKYLRLQQSF